jgi:hypothetical protein
VEQKKNLAMFQTWARFAIELDLVDPDSKFELRRILARLENPRALGNPVLDQLDRWAALYLKDPEEFRGSLALWNEYRAWCQPSGERPMTKPAFLRELRKRESRRWPWFRYGRTKVAPGKGSVQGYWGLKT